MKLYPDQYKRGLLKWTAGAKIGVRTATFDFPGDPQEWSDPAYDDNGWMVTSPPRQSAAVSIVLSDPVLPLSGFQIRWERLEENRIATVVWDNDLDMQPAVLRHVPNYGFFHRLVIAASTLAWNQDVAYRVDDAIVRFHTGTIQVERLLVDDHVEVSDGKPSIGASQETTDVEGRFIDLVAPGDSAAAAELRAFGILGLLALCLGDNVVDSLISSEPYEVVSARDQRGASQATVRAKLPRVAGEAEMDQADMLLPLLLQEGRLSKSRLLGLRWYEKGLRSDSPVDKLLSFFIGMETLVSSFCAEHGELPEEASRRGQWVPIFDELKGRVGKNERNRALAQIVRASLAERVKFFLMRHGLDMGFLRKFRGLQIVRNNAVHGEILGATMEHAMEAEELLVAFLKAELGLVGELPWEHHPRIHALEIRWAFSP